jgi:hypothetical protein
MYRKTAIRNFCLNLLLNKTAFYLCATCRNQLRHCIPVSSTVGPVRGIGGSSERSSSCNALRRSGKSSCPLSLSLPPSLPLPFSPSPAALESGSQFWFCLPRHMGGSVRSRRPAASRKRICLNKISAALAGIYSRCAKPNVSKIEGTPDNARFLSRSPLPESRSVYRGWCIRNS